MRNVALAAVVAFLAITIYSEVRGPEPGDYGRLYSEELPPRLEAKPLDSVREAPTAVADQTHADPMLVAPMQRAQWLESNQEAAPPIAAVAPVESSAPAMGDLTIVGGPEGVTVVRAERRRPVLTGGFGR